jgi:crossover junction endodeoxyribonuclease RusA
MCVANNRFRKERDDLMERLKLTLPPSVNHMYINGRIGHRLSRILSKSAKMWFEETVIKASDWRVKNEWSTAHHKTIVKLWYYFPDYRRRDTHNTIKILMDALEDAQIYVDDRWALPQIQDFEIDKVSPRVEIEFQKVE